MSENLAASLLVLAGLSGFAAVVLAAKLLAAQRAGIRTQVNWPTYTFLTAALLIAWVWVR